MADIADGTSNTMAVAEYLKGTDDSDARGGFWTNRAGCQFLSVRLGPNSTAQDNLCSYDPGFCQNGSGRDQPSQNLPCIGGADPDNYAGSRSRHAGGVNAVFCDGSVHFIQNGVNWATWCNLGHIADHNAIDESF